MFKMGQIIKSTDATTGLCALIKILKYRESKRVNNPGLDLTGHKGLQTRPCYEGKTCSDTRPIAIKHQIKSVQFGGMAWLSSSLQRDSGPSGDEQMQNSGFTE